MSDTIERIRDDFSGVFTEFSEVVQAIEVVMESELYRVEILRAHDSPDYSYGARFLVLREARLTEPSVKEGHSKRDKFTAWMWVAHDYTKIEEQTADLALRRALRILAKTKSRAEAREELETDSTKSADPTSPSD